MTKKEKKAYAYLGYSHLDTAEIVTYLNRVLSNYVVYQQKLRSFCWNVSGRDFLGLYGFFKDMHHRVSDNTDDLAERVRLFGQKPLTTYEAYLQNSNISEETKEVTPYEMAKILLGDIRLMIEGLGEAINAAQEINDYGSEFLLKSLIYNQERDHWKLNEWVKQSM